MKFNPIPLLTACLLVIYSLLAQNDPRYTLMLRSGAFVPQKNISTADLDQLSRTATRTADKAYAVIQFENIPSSSQRQLLQQAGIELLEYIPNYAYTATITGSLRS